MHRIARSVRAGDSRQGRTLADQPERARAGSFHGKGKVDFPRIIRRLKELNYRGAVTIEREISGPQQVEDVRAAKVYLEKLIG